jgi:hypothetical protein
MTGSLAADGQTTATGNLKMGANRITGMADGIAATDAATVGQIVSADLFLLKASNLSDVANATTSRTNLSAAKSGANSDITSITGLTTPLTVAQGGVGANTLAANNVLLGNGTSALQAVAPSTSGNVLTSNGTTWTSAALNLYPLTNGTAVASTSGTSIDFTSIPSWVKRISVLFTGVSVDANSIQQIQLGVSGTPETTGYSAMVANVQVTSNTTRGLTSTAGFILQHAGSSSVTVQGTIVFSLLGSNTWTCNGSIYNREGTSDDGLNTAAGSKALGGTLNMIRITTQSGTANFDAGTINILYE